MYRFPIALKIWFCVVAAQVVSTVASQPVLIADETGRGTLAGRFVYSESPPRPKQITLPKKNQTDGAGRRFPPVDKFYRNKKFYDESLVIDSEGGIANIVVFVRNKDIPVHPKNADSEQSKVVLKVSNGRFVPHILAFDKNRTLFVNNHDPVRLQVELSDYWNDFSEFVVANSVGECQHDFKCQSAVPAQIWSRTNIWMKGYVFPRNNPYVAVSETTGRFVIKDLPVGTWEFQVWHELSGPLVTPDWKHGRFTVDIEPGKNDIGEVEVTPKMRKAKR